MNHIKFYTNNKQPYLNQTKLYSKLDACILEDFLFNQKIKVIESYFTDCRKILLKIFFWENYCHFYNYLLNFEIENIELIKDYKGKTLPGIVLIYLDKYDKVFIRNLLLCHFNSDFSINPRLSIHPHFLIEYNNFNITILDVYDDRGMYVFAGK
jgi:hypothetical protein